MHTQHTSGAAESIIRRSKIDCSDPVLPQRAGAHDARLNSDIEIGLLQYSSVVCREDLSKGDKLGVSGTLFGKSIRICLSG